MNDPDPAVKYAAVLSLLEVAGERWLQELSGIIGRTSGVTLQQVLRGFFHATNYLKIDVGRSKAADLMIDALESALTDTMPEVRKAVIWPLAWMRHERTPGILKRTYNVEDNHEVKAEIVRISTSLMSGITGANATELEAADYILQDALKSSDAKIKSAADEAQRNRQTVAASAPTAVAVAGK
jgi:hypothetical protein